MWEYVKKKKKTADTAQELQIMFTPNISVTFCNIKQARFDLQLLGLGEPVDIVASDTWPWLTEVEPNVLL